MWIDDVVDVRIELRLKLFNLALRHLIGVDCSKAGLATANSTTTAANAWILRRRRNAQMVLFIGD